MNTSIEKLLEAAGLPDNFDAFLRRVMKTLRGSDAAGPDAALALIIAPGENTPGFDLAENFTLEEHARLLEISRGKRKLPEELISAGIDGAGTGGCLLARPGAGRERAAVKRLLTAAAKAISGRLSYEDRERLLTRERDTADATTHLEEVFLSLPEITMEEASRTVLDEARRLTNSPFGFAGHIEPATGHLHIPTLTDNVWKDCRVKKKNFIFKEFNGLWGWVLKNKKPLLTNTAAADPRSGGVPAGHIKISSFLAVPALAGENVLGILALANSPAGYNKADLETARKLARVYSLILKNKLAESRKAAEEQKYRSLLDTLNDLVCNLGPDGRILYVRKRNEITEAFGGSDLRRMRGATNEHTGGL